MPLRRLAGFISAFYNPLQVPNAPTSVSASAGDAQATVTFTAPTNVGGGAITGYGAAAVKTSDGTTLTNTGASSPITVTGLTNDTAYTMNVWALNSYGPSPFGTSGSVTPATRGVFAGGYTNQGINVIQYVAISTTGNAQDFGDLTSVRWAMAGCSSNTRGLFGGGTSPNVNIIEYITLGSIGNATDFGDLTLATRYLGACSSSTRGIFAGGADIQTNVIQYVTIASTGNATDFGDLLSAAGVTGCSSPTRGLFVGSENNVIQYITIATTGNSVDFGDLPASGSWGGLMACASSTRSLFAGGLINTYPALNTISYVTTATTGNTTDFGDLTTTSYIGAACSSEVRGIFGGGFNTSENVNIIGYVTIATTGNATDFGDLLNAPQALSACSSGHGGLQ